LESSKKEERYKNSKRKGIKEKIKEVEKEK
jgi:hypothetical protein